MAISSSLTSAQSHSDVPTWDGLKRAITASSGFRRWCASTERNDDYQGKSQEQLVIAYLRETLETLAY